MEPLPFLIAIHKKRPANRRLCGPDGYRKPATGSIFVYYGIQISPDNETLVYCFFAFFTFADPFHVPGQSCRQPQFFKAVGASLFLPFGLCNHTFAVHIISTSFLFLNCRPINTLLSRFIPVKTGKNRKEGERNV